ncbi:hypothetical protein BaRGS_00008654 [Batillaria attramentaria]|uniref:Uncharacterized protein n=1 Tax=Batillaria attramentaria TaxID=370345 RepID=A0ABD0LLA3_9CAEN
MATVSLISHFSSGLYGNPGSTQQEYQKEGVRFASFKDFPTSSPVSAIRLSQAGFYYTGVEDKVKCFSCGVTYQGWKAGDRPHIIHTNISPNCPLVRGNDTNNMPLPSPVTSVPDFPQNVSGSMDSGYGSHNSDRQPQSQSSTAPSINGRVSMSDVQTDGSEHEPTVYGTNLLSLSGPPALTGPAPNFNALQQGTASADPRSQPSTTGSGALATDSAAPRQPLPSKRLDLGGAVYPLYSQMDARRRSFQNWQHVRGLPSVDELITLGFFYAGYADCVRCFFCGIGLKSWEPDDNPAEVHARWRPTCDYLRLVRGDEFVDRVAGNGNAAERPPARPPPAVRDNAPQAPANNSSNQQQQNNNAPPAAPLPDTPAVRRARISGYRDQQIKEATDAIKNMGMEDQMDGMLFEVLANLNENQPAGRGLSSRTGNTDNQQDGGNNGSELQADGVVADEVPDAVGAAPPGGQNTESRARERQLVLQQENARLRDIRTCQRCHHNSVGVIFLPCGHIVACTDCAPNIRRCIRCDAVIRATANVYFS